MADNTMDKEEQFMKPMDVLKSDINILLLGESGVGKSTFINAFANYLQYGSLEKAMNSDLYCLIPTCFTIVHDCDVEEVVKIGCDENEDQEIGNSSTQGTRAYSFKLEDHKIRLIDTPGIGDARGLEQDNKNFENVLTYISQFNQLHAICFLLKPNHPRLNAYFKFCILHLLSRLEKSAANNIVFIFTNARGTNYKPGETLPILRKLLDDIKNNPPHVEIPCKENIFCFDNEAFRYLAAVKNNNVQFPEEEKLEYTKSWERSVKTCWDLITRIAGDVNNVGLTPHDVGNTLSVNEARRTIMDLSKPLADISDLIDDNLIILKRHEKEIRQEHLSLEQLKEVLYVPALNIKQTSLSQPVVVCTARLCSDSITIAGMTKYHYKKQCHRNCTCSLNIQQQIIGSSELLSCEIFNRNKACSHCGCDFSTHMRVLYETELFMDKLEDANVKTVISTKEEALEAQLNIVKLIQDRINEFDEEQIIISKTLSRFANFLKVNSISTQNDAYGDYIEYLIERENSLGPKKDKELIVRYQTLQKQHEAELMIMANVEESTNPFHEKPESILTPERVAECVQKLYDLKHSGKKIQELHKKQAKVRNRELEESMEYCHPNKINKPGKAKNRNRNKNKAEKKKNNEKDELFNEVLISHALKNLKLDKGVVDKSLIGKLVKECLQENLTEFNSPSKSVDEPNKNKFVPNKSKKDYSKKMDNKNHNLQMKNKERQFKTATKQFMHEKGQQSDSSKDRMSKSGSIPNLLDVGNNQNQFGNIQHDNQFGFGNHPAMFSNNKFGHPNQFGNNYNPYGMNQFGGIPNLFENNPNPFGKNPNQFRGINPNQFLGNRPNLIGNNPNQFGNNQNQFTNNPNQFQQFPICQNQFVQNPQQFANPNNAGNPSGNNFKQFNNASNEPNSSYNFKKNPIHTPKNKKPNNMEEQKKKFGSNPNLNSNVPSKPQKAKNINPDSSRKDNADKTKQGNNRPKNKDNAHQAGNTLEKQNPNSGKNTHASSSSGTIPKVNSNSQFKKKADAKKGNDNRQTNTSDIALKLMKVFTEEQMKIKEKKGKEKKGEESFVMFIKK